eukprot:202552_1
MNIIQRICDSINGAKAIGLGLTGPIRLNKQLFSDEEYNQNKELLIASILDAVKNQSKPQCFEQGEMNEYHFNEDHIIIHDNDLENILIINNDEITVNKANGNLLQNIKEILIKRDKRFPRHLLTNLDSYKIREYDDKIVFELYCKWTTKCIDECQLTMFKEALRNEAKSFFVLKKIFYAATHRSKHVVPSWFISDDYDADELTEYSDSEDDGDEKEAVPVLTPYKISTVPMFMPMGTGTTSTISLPEIDENEERCYKNLNEFGLESLTIEKDADNIYTKNTPMDGYSSPSDHTPSYTPSL